VSGATVAVRVLPERALTLVSESGLSSSLYVTRDELVLPVDEARALIEQGFVERT
jgi:hypothetical protein